MEIRDNMGGFVAAEFVLLREVASFVRVAGGVRVGLMSEQRWKRLDMQRYGAKLSVKPSVEDGGILHSINGSVDMVPDAVGLDVFERNTLILLRLTKPTGERLIVGTIGFPLRASVGLLAASSPSGFAGWSLQYEGKQSMTPMLEVE